MERDIRSLNPLMETGLALRIICKDGDVFEGDYTASGSLAEKGKKEMAEIFYIEISCEGIEIDFYENEIERIEEI